MKTKITVLIGAVALVTLSFTFSSNDSASKKSEQKMTSSSDTAPIGGFIADEIVK
jgi:hypothetical protein